jgi:hypothetical protein
MDPNRLFVGRCQQLSDLLASRGELEHLDLAGILRQLLADQHSLVHTVNSGKVPIRFRVGVLNPLPLPLPRPVYHGLEDGLDPDTARPGKAVAIVDLEGFLKHTVVIAKDVPHSVKDIIKFAANVAGGIHHDPNPKPEHQIIAECSSVFGIGGLPACVRQLRSITRVTLKGLAPLLDDVKKRAA